MEISGQFFTVAGDFHLVSPLGFRVVSVDGFQRPRGKAKLIGFRAEHHPCDISLIDVNFPDVTAFQQFFVFDDVAHDAWGPGTGE